MNKIETGYHNATRYAHRVNGEEVWVAWCKVEGKRVATEECASEPEARAWCALQRVQRKSTL